MWRCPHCLKKVDYLSYSVSVSETEYGAAGLTEHPKLREDGSIIQGTIINDHEHTDSSGSEWSDDPSYNCPECDEGVELEELVFYAEEEIKEPEKMEEETHEIQTNTIKVKRSNPQPGFSESAIVCMNPKCHHLFVFDPTGLHPWDFRDGDTFAECPRCGYNNDVKKFYESITSGQHKKKRIVKKRLIQVTVPHP